MSTIAERLLTLRGKAKQGEFAKLLGINPNTLRSYENGRSSPNQDFLEQICVQFSVSPEWLLLGRGTMDGKNGDSSCEHEDAQAESVPCARCARLEMRLEAVEGERRSASEKLVEALQANLALLTELGEQRVTNLKLAQQLDTARRMCSDYEAAIKAAGVTSPIFGEKPITQLNDCK